MRGTDSIKKEKKILYIFTILRQQFIKLSHFAKCKTTVASYTLNLVKYLFQSILY